MNHLVIIGFGTMGSDIAKIAARVGMKVDVVVRNLETISSRKARLFNWLRKKADLSREQVDINFYDNLDCCKDAEIVLETISENFQAKKQLLETLDTVISPKCLILSNTSTISITQLGSCVSNPDRVVGLHFFNPATSLSLVELVVGVHTSDETIEKAEVFAGSLDKQPVKVDDSPGFIVNRLLLPMINEAVALYAEGVSTAEGIDSALKMGALHPIGPLALADLIGLDVCVQILDILRNEMGDLKYRPHPLLNKMVRAGHLGRKTKQGFYSY